MQRKIKQRAQRRDARVKHSLSPSRPRLAVFRSLNNIYAQIIDDAQGKTVASCSSLELKDVTGAKKVVAHAVGVELAKRAKAQGVDSVVFDRGRYLYHGRVQSLADGLKEGGLTV
ncbi:MAG TPA: 50S ribosomal protein L18 [Mariniflexile sp.]